VYNTLFQYLILHRQLCLPGIGTIYLQRISSELDFGNKIFTAPAYRFRMETDPGSPSKKLFGWLSKLLHITEWDAIRMVNDFSFDLKNKIFSEGKVSWQPVGTLHRDEKGNITLDPALIQLESEVPVQAEKVIREKAEHTVLVGEMEKSSFELEELLTGSSVKKDYGWIIAIVITVLSFLFVGWFLSEKGLHPSSTGNQAVLETK
jgi:hypothetical protein